MKKFFNSAIGYIGGAVNVKLYDWNKVFKPGDKVKISISSQLRLTKVAYRWDDGEKKEVRTFFNRCYFNTRMPKVAEDKPVLKIITEVQFKDGTLQEDEHAFEINNMF